ncbi:unnamed protein product [Caenorhabditis bovis]|uniref:Uncharacterized protein n=1 Tax=Caenorhabditis bovis TaxID=2654633 RepID=A0A8S1EFA4_9PELO|nr:unnamed protein product [Caenorhabditis bovis]
MSTLNDVEQELPTEADMMEEVSLFSNILPHFIRTMSHPCFFLPFVSSDLRQQFENLRLQAINCNRQARFIQNGENINLQEEFLRLRESYASIQREYESCLAAVEELCGIAITDPVQFMSSFNNPIAAPEPEDLEGNYYDENDDVGSDARTIVFSDTDSEIDDDNDYGSINGDNYQIMEDQHSDEIFAILNELVE